MTVKVPLSSPYYPVVLRGAEVKALLGAADSKIRAIARHGNVLETIPFQIDKRDASGNYDLVRNVAGNPSVLGATDECVFMTADAGERITLMPEQYAQQTAVEIALVDPKSGAQKWVYLLETKSAQYLPAPGKHHVAYDPLRDVIETNTYRIGFSSAQPFIVSSLQWHTGETNKWSPNVLDTMKIRHHGKLFGNIDFIRTQDDYLSRIAAVKEGPVRVIRRTINSVRVIGYLQSPSVTIDYVAYANGFQMDTTIDFPFPLGWFFSDIKTLTTIDWNDDPALPGLRIHGGDTPKGLAVDGHMTPEKERFNNVAGQRFAVANAYGLLLVQLEMEKTLPVAARLTLQDDRTRPDAPENIPGQYGNVGFLTTGWEKVGTSVHHLLFNALLLQKTSMEQGSGMLGRYPWKNP
ncbi:MAG: hypothetical protein KJ958_13020 [Gammaproteobacteria bacterium]|nr:hypothetical protein [Gammaproteobacteria bacterium]MBU1980080.1 hypothetical protein [Gammaproteobacteria bacterium]